MRHLWSSTPSSAIPFPDLVLDPITFSPPLTDVRYMLEVTDSFTCSIHVVIRLYFDSRQGGVYG
ncbi:MAG: hypothetical protein MZV63_53935 [Marinilabiliales bacterium]|nr:hypothetical protein [Marinilabiliales bacterium]